MKHGISLFQSKTINLLGYLN